MSGRPNTYPDLSQPVWLAARLKNEAAVERFAGAMERMEVSYNGDTATRKAVSRSDVLALYSISPEPPLFDVPLVLAEPDLLVCSTHIMPTMLQTREDSPSRYLRQFSNLLCGDLPEVWKVLPPLASVCLFTRMDAIYAATDFFGCGRVYTASDGDPDLLSSALAPIVVARDRCPKIGEDAWASYAALDWLLDERSFLRGCRSRRLGQRPA
jgi:hypothetical protein